jgi:hypothetical protein
MLVVRAERKSKHTKPATSAGLLEESAERAGLYFISRE